jgi:hypothetical protein
MRNFKIIKSRIVAVPASDKNIDSLIDERFACNE